MGVAPTPETALRKASHKWFLSFSWKRQKHKREEYLSLYYIKCPRLWRETVLKLEDELNVEQILLYWSLAHAVHVWGMGMSHILESILELQLNQKVESLETRPGNSDSHTGKGTQPPHWTVEERPKSRAATSSVRLFFHELELVKNGEKSSHDSN